MITAHGSLKLKFYFPLAVALLAVGPVRPQAPDRITRPVDASQVQILSRHHPLWAIPANDAGAVPADLAVKNLTLVLARSPQQEEAFEQLLNEQNDPASPNYHQWLTPGEIGERFGLSDNDIVAITGWLQSQGLRVNWIAPSRLFIGFSGAAADLNRAFDTELHYYKVHDEQLMSVASDPLIPAVIAPALKSIRGLYTIEDRPFHVATPFLSSSPALTISSGGVSYHFVTPGDFANIYDLPSGLTGAGTTIGIVGEARTDAADFNNFKSLTSSTFGNPTEVIPTAYGGADPGPASTTSTTCGSPSACELIDDQAEATLDVTRAGSVAPGASLLLVTSSAASGGIAVDAQYLVQTSPVQAQVMSISFGACESQAGSSGVSFWDSLFQQAAAEGISVFVSSGDSGASGCDAAFATPPASPMANSPNYICSSSYATCVGGTEFNDTVSPSTYWNSVNGAGLASALGYIPEGAWNEPIVSGSSTEVAASGGGVSAFIFTPTWQTGAGVPVARSGRYTPDVSFSASSHDGYLGCFAAGSGSCVSGPSGAPFIVFSGTSATAPGMAGVAALLDQKSGSALGNLNPAIYSTATSTPGAFHQVSVVSSGVSNCSVSTPSMCNNSIPGPAGLTGGQAGYQLGATGGYSEVTGLGSLDVAQFVTSFSGGSKLTPTVTLSAPPAITTAQSASVEITVTSSGSAIPTGSVTLSSGSYNSVSTVLNIPGTGSNSVYIVIPSNSLAVGTDTITASYTSNSSTYNNATGSAAITVTSAKPAPTITWATPAAIVYGTPLSNTQFDATASVPGTFTYFPAAGTVLTAGQQALGAGFTPNDTTDYSDAYATVTLTVNKATPVLTWATPASVPAGTVLGPNQLNASANVPGNFTYSPVSGTLMSTPGNFMISATLAPTDSTDYTIATASVILSVTAVTTAPSVITGGATTITGTSVTLNGQAIPNGTDTHAWFLYGTSSTLSGATQTTSQDVGAGYTGAIFSAGATGLSPNTTYYFQAVAQNSFGTTMGSIQSFTTAMGPTFTLNGGSVTLAKGATSGNTTSINVASSGGFTGTVALSAAVTNSPTGAQEPPTLTWSPSNQVSLTGAGNASATLIITTLPATVGANDPTANPRGRFFATGGSALACIAFFLLPIRRRSWRNLFGLVALCVALTFGAISCGGNS
ncbi:MAG: protease pro-enzyme activation domain-containing protein, partial [Terracidiphilus sp.]